MENCVLWKERINSSVLEDLIAYAGFVQRGSMLEQSLFITVNWGARRGKPVILEQYVVLLVIRWPCH